MKVVGFMLLSAVGLLCGRRTFSQTLSGYVRDAQTGETLPNVNIYSNTKVAYGTSNEYGYFSLNLGECPCRVVFSFVGYETATKYFDTANPPQFQNIELSRSASSLDEITVKPSIRSFPLGLVSIPMERLLKIPPIFGETDVLKALALTPGVANATEGTAGILVRGGSHDQNLILLDETPVYNVTHLFGFVSVFNPDAIKDVKLYKAGFPARYGGRLSSVIDITSKEGSPKKLHKEVSIGMINSRLLFEGPLNIKSKNWGTFLAAARLTNLSLLLLPTYLNYKFVQGGQYFNYNLYDVNLKWNKAFQDHSQVFFNLYSGNDVWFVKSKYDNAYGKFKINWGNLTASVRYIKPLGQKLFLKNTLAYSGFGHGLGSFLVEKGSTQNFVKSKSTLNDVLLKSTLELYPNSQNEIRVGGALTFHAYRPVYIRSSYSMAVPDNKETVGAWEKAAFAEWNLQPTPWLGLQSGIRIVDFSVQDTGYMSLEPRLALSLYPFENTALKLGYSKMGQFLHLLTVSSIGLSNSLWIPASRRLPFEKAVQYSMGVSQKLKGPWRIDLDIYRKSYSDLVDYKSGQNFIINSEENYEDSIEKSGIGKSYGLELLLDKSEGQFTGWLAYTYAFNWRKFENINGGKWFASNHDRRHTLNITGAYRLSPRVECSAIWVFQTGGPITVPVATHSTFISSGDRYPGYIYGDRNNFRTPNYHRLDFNFNISRQTKRGHDRLLSLGVYNAYNHNNSFFLKTNYQPIPNPGRTGFVGWDIRVSKNNFIPFLPYITYSLKFK